MVRGREGEAEWTAVGVSLAKRLTNGLISDHCKTTGG